MYLYTYVCMYVRISVCGIFINFAQLKRKVWCISPEESSASTCFTPPPRLPEVFPITYP